MRNDCRISSLSSWRAWIEICTFQYVKLDIASLSSWRAWIEISDVEKPTKKDYSRSPHGERGLKYASTDCHPASVSSLSSWRAWIEITHSRWLRPHGRSLSSWRAWIEIMLAPPAVILHKPSLSSWRAWIEIALSRWKARKPSRSPHGERGLKWVNVAGREIRVSRSPHGERGLKYTCRESGYKSSPSLSSWRAWIEIIASEDALSHFAVALLMESVD